MSRAKILKSATKAGSANERWATPTSIVAQLGAPFGGFDLDAAALSHNAAAAEYIGPDHPDPTRRDAFSARPWRETDGAIWLNPPYVTLDRWVERAIIESRRNRYSPVVMLIFARVETQWWARAQEEAAGVCLFTRRLPFLDPLADGPRTGKSGAMQTATAPSAALIFGRALRSFSTRPWVEYLEPDLSDLLPRHP